jgi:hypothetical protein
VLSATEQGLLLRFTAGHTDFCAQAMKTAEGV